MISAAMPKPMPGAGGSYRIKLGSQYAKWKKLLPPAWRLHRSPASDSRSSRYGQVYGGRASGRLHEEACFVSFVSTIPGRRRFGHGRIYA
jgi:hypothetical protein